MSDFDACWGSGGVTLNRLDPELLTFSNGPAAQKAHYGDELTLPSGPQMQKARHLPRLRPTRPVKQPKGIVAINLGGLP